MIKTNIEEVLQAAHKVSDIWCRLDDDELVKLTGEPFINALSDLTNRLCDLEST